MRIGICDDNEIYLNYLHNYTLQLLSERNDVDCNFILPKELCTMVAEQDFKYDILITDIDLGEINAINMIKEIQYFRPNCIVIFVSNYLRYATEVYDVNHIYFVLKSEAEQRLPIALDKAIRMIRERQNNFINFSYQHQNYQVPLVEITYIEALGRYLHIHTQRQEYKCIRPLKEFAEELSSCFGRCHNSYIVNFKHVRTFNQSECIMVDGTIIPISYTYNKSFFAAYKLYIVKYI